MEYGSQGPAEACIDAGDAHRESSGSAFASGVIALVILHSKPELKLGAFARNRRSGQRAMMHPHDLP